MRESGWAVKIEGGPLLQLHHLPVPGGGTGPGGQEPATHGVPVGSPPATQRRRADAIRRGGQEQDPRVRDACHHTHRQSVPPHGRADQDGGANDRRYYLLPSHGLSVIRMASRASG